MGKVMSDKQRTHFPFFLSFFESINNLDPMDQLPIYKAIAEYAFFQKEPEFNGVSKSLWTLIRPILDASHKNFKNGGKGGAPKGSRNNPNGRRANQELTQNKPITNQKLSNKDKEEDMDKDKGENNKRTAKRFTPPTLDEVRDYITQKGYTINPQSFIDYYTSNGWRVGKNPMKNWKAALSSWNSRDDGNRYSTVQTPQKTQQYDEL